MSDKAAYIKGSEGNVTVCVDDYDGENVWIALRANHGGMHCYMSHEQAKKMIEALKSLVEATCNA